MDILAPIQHNDRNVRVTTIRLTPGGQKVIERLMELTGQQSQSSMIRYGLRRLLWDVERATRGETPDNRPTTPVTKVAPQSDNRPFSVSRK